MMEELPENRSVVDEQQGDATVEKPVASVGCSLRAGRERLGLSVEDVVNKIKLAPRQIVALEADDFQSLPEPAFVRGFVRSYAKLLQLDAQPLLDALPGARVEQVKTEQIHVDAPFPSERTARRQNLNLLIAAFVIALIIAAFALWQSNSSQQEPVIPPTTQSENAMVATPLPLPEQVEMLDGSGVPGSGVPAESGVPVASAVQAAPQVAVSPVKPTVATTVPTAALRITFDKESWAEIKDKTGKTLLNQINHPGSELQLDGVAPFTLVIGHATAVHLFFRGKPVDLSSYVNAYSDVARLTLE